MKKYVLNYLNWFNYDLSDFIPCEVCGAQAVDIHHIDCRGMGGSKHKDNIENLMAVCRKCHIDYGDKKEHKEFLIEKHNAKLNGTSRTKRLLLRNQK